MIFITRKQATSISSWLDIEQDEADETTALIMVAEDTPYIATIGAAVKVTISGQSVIIDTDGSLTAAEEITVTRNG